MAFGGNAAICYLLSIQPHPLFPTILTAIFFLTRFTLFTSRIQCYLHKRSESSHKKAVQDILALLTRATEPIIKEKIFTKY